MSLYFIYEAARFFPQGELHSGGSRETGSFFFICRVLRLLPFPREVALGRDFFLLGKPSGGSLLMILEDIAHFPAAEGGGRPLGGNARRTPWRTSPATRLRVHIVAFEGLLVVAICPFIGSMFHLHKVFFRLYLLDVF